MKSFGVRLAAGAGTILVVAYAIALAQKDKQAVSGSWNAETAVATDPAEPIGSAEPPAWLEQPDNQLADQQQALAFAGPEGTPSTVQPVNYDETGSASSEVASAGFGALPGENTGTPQATVLATPQIPLPETAVFSSEVAASVDADAPTALAAPTAAFDLPEAPTGTFAADPEFNTNPEPDNSGATVDELPPGFAGGTAGLGSPMSELPSAAVSATADTSEAADLASDGLAVLPPGSAVAAPTGVPPFEPVDAAIEVPAAGSPVAGIASAEALPADNTLQESPETFSPPANSLRDSGPASNQLRGESINPDSSFVTNQATGIDRQTTILGNPETVISESLPAGANPVATQELATSMATSAIEAAGASIMVDAALPGGTSTAAPVSGADDPANMMNTQGSASTGFAENPVSMVPPNAAAALNPNATTDAPGERRLEGAQTPSVIIQKRAPAEVKVGKPAAFVIHVRNVGAVEALDVEVHDRIPAGMRLADATPAPQMQGNHLMWQIGSMPAGDERTITLQLIPEQEGELGSVARVSFEAAASVRTIATRPMLTIEQQAPEQVLIGQQLEIGLTFANTGSGKATNVEIWEDVPAGLSHPEGPQLKQRIGTLMPGEKRNDSLFLKAEQPGIIQNTIRLVGDDGLTAEQTVSVEVIAPTLEVALEGPSRRFLERQAKYELNIANSGTAAATNVEISVQLSRGFTFVSTDFQGQYDPDRHAVFWSLAQLPAGAKGVVPLTLLPVETGEQVIRINANADLGTVAQTERKMTVEGFADLGFSITNPNGPIEIGAETTYDIVVQNSGSKADTNIRVQVQLPAGLQLLGVDGEAGTDGNGLVAFQPKAKLEPGKEFKYRVRVRGVTAGTHIAKAVVVSDHSSVPVTKEDTTRVYADK